MARFVSALCVVFLLLGAAAATLTASAQAPVDDYFAVHTPVFTTPGKVNTIIPLSDGRALIAGVFTAVGSQPAAHSIAIIRADGTLDPAFTADPDLYPVEVYDADLQADGKFVLAGWFYREGEPGAYWIVRLNANGSLDEGFVNWAINGQVHTLLVDGDKIVIGGSFPAPTPRIGRLNANGSTDATFNGVGAGPASSSGGSVVWDIARQSSGMYVIAGDFDTYNGDPQPGLARLTTTGALDNSFVPAGFRSSRSIAVLADDSVVVGAGDDWQCRGDDPVFARYTASGSPITIQPGEDPNDNFEQVRAILPLPDGGMLIGGWHTYGCYETSPFEHNGQVWRLAANGSLLASSTFGDRSDVFALARRSDGKILIGGQGRPEDDAVIGLFDGLLLYDPAGSGLSPVTSFHPVIGDEAEIYSLSRYPDGRVLVGGNFSHASGLPRFGVARLLASGALDTTFAPFAGRSGGRSQAVLALPDGRAVAGFRDAELYVLAENGSISVDLSSLNNHDSVSALALQADGKVLVGSDFGLGVRRFRADFLGTDSDFIPGSAYGGSVRAIVPAGNFIYIAGSFISYNGMQVNQLVRLDGDGGIIQDFTPPALVLDEWNAATIYSVLPLADGKVLVASNAHEGDEGRGLIRLTSSGARDGSFTEPTTFYEVRSVCVDGSGTIWAGGQDSTYYRYPLVQHLPAAGGTVLADFQTAFRSAHMSSDGRVFTLLCGADGIEWSSGKFSIFSGRGFHSLVRHFPLVGEVFLPNLMR